MADKAENNSNTEPSRRSEKAGLFHFTKDMISALAMALIAIVYVIQAFKIPTGSMEKSLMVGDFLLGLKFVYGAPVLPFMYTKFPGITNPKPGDVIIFKYPGSDNKDYIKRCVAGPGQTIQVSGKTVTVDGHVLTLAPNGRYIQNGQLDPHITEFKPLRVPKKGDTLNFETTTEEREFLFYKQIVKQENPHKKAVSKYQLYVNGEFANNERVVLNEWIEVPFSNINFNQIDNWIEIDTIVHKIYTDFPGKTVDIRHLVYLDDKQVKKYVVKNDNYFMMGDNRDNSMDSRYWGFLNRNFIKAKAFILYFSEDKDIPIWELPLKIRWNRIGKLIRSWDGGLVTK